MYPPKWEVGLTSTPTILVYYISDWLTGDESAKICSYNFDAAICCMGSRTRGVGCDNHILHAPERMVSGERFGFKYIQSSAGDFTRF